MFSLSNPGAPSGKEPIFGSFSAQGQVSEPFSPVPGRVFYYGAHGNFSGTIQLFCKFPGTDVWTPQRFKETDIHVITQPTFHLFGFDINGVLARLECIYYFNGPINYWIMQ